MSRSIAAFAASCAVLPVFGAVAVAAEVKLLPALLLKEEYNDNIFFSSTDSRSSFITTVSGGCALLRNTERLATKAAVRWDGLLYSDSSTLNALEQRYNAEGAYLFSPLLRIGGSAAFSRESRPDRLIESTGLVVVQQSSHQRYALAGDVTLSEKATGQFSYGYDQVDYHDPSVSNFERHSAKGTVAYDLDGMLQLLKVRTSAGFSGYRYTTSSVDDYSMTVGFTYPFHELWTIQSDLGGRYTHSDFSQQLLPSQNLQQSSDGFGFIADVLVSYRGEKGNASLAFSRTIQNAAGLSGAMQSTALSLLATRRFSYELTGSLTVGYYLNKADRGEFSGHVIDESALKIAPSLRYQVSRDLALELFYEYVRVDSDQRSVSGRNKVGASVTFQKPLWE